MSVIVPISSALPLKADVAAVSRESPSLTHNGHLPGRLAGLCLIRVRSDSDRKRELRVENSVRVKQAIGLAERSGGGDNDERGAIQTRTAGAGLWGA